MVTLDFNASFPPTTLEELEMTASLDAEQGTLTLTSLSGRSLKLDLATGVMALRAEGGSSEVTQEKMIFEAENEWLRARLCIQSLTGRMKNGKPEINNVKGTLLIHEK